MSLSLPQRVLITGASRGIGRATAITFAKAGVSSILVARSQDALQEVAQQVQRLGVEAFTVPLDLAQPEGVKPQLEAALASVGAVDILVNNAGMGYTGALREMPLQDWQQVIDLNLTSPLQCIQAVLPGMRSRQQGTIINVLSVAARQAFPEWGAYCASKFGLMGMTKVLAQEERTHGIRVVALCPGSVNTPLWDTPTVQANFDRTLMLKPEDIAASIVHAALSPQHVVVEELVITPNAGTF